MNASIYRHVLSQSSSSRKSAEIIKMLGQMQNLLQTCIILTLKQHIFTEVGMDGVPSPACGSLKILSLTVGPTELDIGLGSGLGLNPDPRQHSTEYKPEM
jgi:hypothetical protein